MINKDTNTQCRWTSIFFLLTLYHSLKNFLSGTSNAIFFTSNFLTPFSGENGLFGARPVGKMNTQMQVLSRCSVFFFHFGTLLQEKSEANTFYWNHRLKKSGRELKSKSSLARFKVTPIIFGLYVSDFCMSSCREPTCPLFWLEQELHVEGEQVEYFKVQFSFVVFRWNARSHSRHPFHDHSDGRRVAKMSCDSKYIVKKGLNS